MPISDREIGLVEARHGENLPPTQGLGKTVLCNHFLDARAFLVNGGQKGPQMSVLTQGHHEINTALFEVTIVPITKVSDGEIGLVEARYGASLSPAQGLGKIVPCDHFEDAEAFLVSMCAL